METTSVTNDVLMRLEDASKVYRMGEVEVHALRGVTLGIRQGEFLVIMGASGSGKSTLLNLLGGMDRPTTGSVIFGDRDLAGASDGELTLFRRREIGFVFQFYNLMPTLTARENVEVGAAVVERPMDALEALELVNMSDRAEHFPSQLSGGEQQRVAIARAIASDPKLLLCDEPTGALDSVAAAQVIDLISSLNRSLRKTVVFVTHNPTLARLGDRLAVLHDGAIQRIEAGKRSAPPGETVADIG